MVRPGLRSHSMARKKRRLPGNRVKVHYKRRKPASAHCALTKKKLHGVPTKRPAKLRQLSKTERRPSRPYGGKLSHEAVEDAVWDAVREEYHEDIDKKEEKEE